VCVCVCARGEGGGGVMLEEVRYCSDVKRWLNTNVRWKGERRTHGTSPPLP
jgi:hypothetical protein